MILARRIPGVLGQAARAHYLRDGTDPVAVVLSSTTLRILPLGSTLRGPHDVGVDAQGRLTLVGRTPEGPDAARAVPAFPPSPAESSPGFEPHTYAGRFLTSGVGLARRAPDVKPVEVNDAWFSGAAAVAAFGRCALVQGADGSGSLVDVDANTASAGPPVGKPLNFGDRLVCVRDVTVENGSVPVQQSDTLAPSVQGVYVPGPGVRNGRSDVRLITEAGIAASAEWDFTGLDAASLSFLWFRRPWLRLVQDLGSYQGHRVATALRWFDGWYAQPLSGSFSPANGGGAQYLLYQLTRDVIMDQCLVIASPAGALTVRQLQALQRRTRTPVQCWRRNGSNVFFKRSGSNLTSLFLSEFPTNAEAIVRPWPSCRLGSSLYGARGGDLRICLKFEIATGALGSTAQVPAGLNPAPLALPHAGALVARAMDGETPRYFASRDAGATWNAVTLEGTWPQASWQPLFSPA